MFRKILYVLDKRQKREVVALLFMILLNSVFELLGVSAVLPLISAVTEPERVSQNAFLRFCMEFLQITDIRRLVSTMALLLVAVYIVKNCFILWMTRCLYHFVYQNQRKLAVLLMDSYMHQDYAFHTTHNVAELQRNVTNDAVGFFAALQYIIELAIEILVCVVLIVYLALIDIRTTLVIALIMGVLLLLFMKVFRKRLKQLGEANRVLNAEKTKWFLQSLNGIKEIKTTDRENYFLARYESVYRENAGLLEKQVFLANMPKPVVEMCSISAILIYMAVRIGMGEELSGFVSVLSVFAMAAFRMLPSFNRISGYLGSLMFNIPSVNAVYEDIKEIESLRGKEKQHNLDETKQLSLKEKLELSKVCFSYPAKPDTEVLRGVSISVPAKSSVALVGSSGAGKTTVVDLILGLYEPGSGSITADGVNIFEHERAWHKLVGYIPQTIYLIDDTVRANIAFGIPAGEVNDAAVWQALEEAQLADFIRQNPEGLDQNIGDRGVKLSGGQRQRIGIARALYHRPELLILDEATSALDSETESAVMDAIYRLSGRLTMIVIAHRITTIKSCDIIYRMEEGRARRISYEEALGET